MKEIPNVHWVYKHDHIDLIVLVYTELSFNNLAKVNLAKVTKINTKSGKINTSVYVQDLCD